MEFILAVDPGLKSGVCLVNRDTLEMIYAAELDVEETEDWVEEILTHPVYQGHTEVVVETFRISTQTAKHSSATWSLELIGVVRNRARRLGAGTITLQTPADAKAFTSNDKLRTLGWWQKGGAGHAHDAMRHAALRLVRTGCTDRTLLGLD